MEEDFNKEVKKILKNSTVESDVLINQLMKNYQTNNYHYAFDELMYKWNAVFKIENLLNYSNRLKYKAVVGFQEGEIKIMRFTRWDAAVKWLAKETLYFIRREIDKK